MDMHAAFKVLTIFAGIGFAFVFLSGSGGRACYAALAVWALLWAATAAVA